MRQECQTCELAIREQRGCRRRRYTGAYKELDRTLREEFGLSGAEVATAMDQLADGLESTPPPPAPPLSDPGYRITAPGIALPRSDRAQP